MYECIGSYEQAQMKIREWATTESLSVGDLAAITWAEWYGKSVEWTLDIEPIMRAKYQVVRRGI